MRHGAPALRASEALRIAAMVRRLGEIFHGPQDVEWAFVGDELHVLQSRPITTWHPTGAASWPRRPCPLPGCETRSIFPIDSRHSEPRSGGAPFTWPGEATATFGLLIRDR